MKKPALHTAYRTLLADLGRAADTYEKMNEDEGKRQALDAVIDFVLHTHFDRRLTRPLDHLMKDLTPRKGKALPLGQALDHAWCAATVDLLMARGDTLGDALTSVHKATRKKLSVKYLTDHRKNLRSRRGKNRTGQEFYWSVLRRKPGRDANERARLALGVVSDLFDPNLNSVIR